MGKLLPDTSVVTFYRRSIVPADSFIVNSGENAFPSLDTKRITIVEGEWVTLDASKKAIKLGAAPGAAGLLAFPVWVSDRKDAGAALAVTVIHGVHSGRTSVFNVAAGPYAPGSRLTAKLVAGLRQLTLAAAGDAIVAIAEGAAEGADAQFPDGFLPYTTVNAGGIQP